jgi:indole-3-glycerol phosphate synthase
MILDQILAKKRERVREWVPLAELRARVALLAPARSLSAALRDGGRPAPRVIAEVKRKSPSAGPIRPGADPGVIAAEYARAGAAAISVLTDEPFFDGALDHLGRARAACDLPILRKDFLTEERDLCEARLHGGDAALVIVRLLDPGQLRELIAAGEAYGLELLVETHDPRELETALAAGARIVGINHRDLDSLQIDRSLSEGARALSGPEVTLVGESGLKTHDDLLEMAARGLDAVLVGEALMRAASPGQKLKELLGCS